MLRVLTAAQMRQVERYAVENVGISGSVLMESAGRSVFAEIHAQEGDVAHKRIVVVCGPGNNGGDGFVIARYLHLAGARVDLLLPEGIRPKQPDALKNLLILENMGLPIKRAWSSSLYNVVVDALFGTGLDRPMSAPYLESVRTINRLKAPVYAVDLPSGLHSDTGMAMGDVVYATRTVTFGFKKRGLFLNDGPEASGDVRIADISLAEGWIDKDSDFPLFETESQDLKGWFKKRKRQSHKVSNGHVLVLAGSPSKSGAAVLACRAALRAGVGLATLATPKSAHTIVKRQLMEAMSIALPDDGDGKLPPSSLELLMKASKGKQAIVIGPGLEPDSKLRDLLLEFIKKTDVPIVLDADGLNAFGESLVKIGTPLHRMILTPHPGEMARLIGLTAKEVQANRIAVADEYAQKSGAVVVLKGHYTVVALPSGRTFINPTGNPAMATAGTGDVLSGVIGSYVAQGLPLDRAAIAGVFHHGLAGDIASRRIGGKGMIASDLIEYLPSL